MQNNLVAGKQEEIPFNDQKQSLLGVIEVNQEQEQRLYVNKKSNYTPIYPIPLPSRLINEPPEIKAEIG